MISPLTKDDRSFVFDSWVKSYSDVYYERDAQRHIVSANTPMPHAHYVAAQSALVELLLGRSTCLVYRSPVDAGVIRGYAVGEQRGGVLVLHWAFTRSQRRREGVMRELLAELRRELGCVGDGGLYTHRKNPGGYWLEAMGFEFEPKAIGEKR